MLKLMKLMIIAIFYITVAPLILFWKMFKGFMWWLIIILGLFII